MPIAEGTKKNFETLQRAFEAEQVALMECTDTQTGKLVNVICAVQYGDEENPYEFVPFAVMADGTDPYERFIPPFDEDADLLSEQENLLLPGEDESDSGRKNVSPEAVAKIVAMLEGLGMDSNTLDELVHECKSLEASKINNGGMDEQVRFLAESFGGLDEAETYILESTHMTEASE